MLKTFFLREGCRGALLVGRQDFYFILLKIRVLDTNFIKNESSATKSSRNNKMS